MLTPVGSPAQDKLAMLVSVRRVTGNPIPQKSSATRWEQYDMRAGKVIPVPQLPDVAQESVYFQPLSWSPDGAFIAGVRLEARRHGRRARRCVSDHNLLDA